MTTRIAEEGRPAWLPGVQLNHLPAGLPPSIRVLSKHGELGIEAQGVVGSIPLRDGTTLQILPKVGQTNFLRMLFRSHGVTEQANREFEEFVNYGTEDEPNLATLAARRLVIAADGVLRQGVALVRRRQRTRSVALAGHVDAASTALAIARREADPVVTTLRRKTNDSPENRVIAVALARSVSLLAPQDRPQGLEVIARWKRRVDATELTDRDLETVEERVAARWYGGPRAYYEPAVTLALVTLGTLGLSAAADPTVHGDALLMNSADVFERYVRRVIRDHYSDRGFIVTKGGSVSRSLYQDGSFEIDPDVVIERRGRIELIADAKYKRPTSNDHYQMQAYLGTSETQLGALLTPNGINGEPQVHRYVTPSGLATCVVDLPVDQPARTEAFLAELLNHVR